MISGSGCGYEILRQRSAISPGAPNKDWASLKIYPAMQTAAPVNGRGGFDVANVLIRGVRAIRGVPGGTLVIAMTFHVTTGDRLAIGRMHLHKRRLIRRQG